MCFLLVVILSYVFQYTWTAPVALVSAPVKEQGQSYVLSEAMVKNLSKALMIQAPAKEQHQSHVLLSKARIKDLYKAMIKDSSNATLGCLKDKTPCKTTDQCNQCNDDCLKCCNGVSARIKGKNKGSGPATYCGLYMNSVQCWGDGERCMAGSTCNLCCKGTYQHWWSDGITSCGYEPCWGGGTRCLGGTSCGRCCCGAKWSWRKFGRSVLWHEIAHFCK